MRFSGQAGAWGAAVLAGWLAGAAQAGTVTGTVRAEGKAGVAEAAAGGRYESRRLKFAPRVDYSALKDFVVYLEGPATNLPPPKPRQVVIQKDAVFTPHVMPVQVGTTIEWPNADDIYHNVFSFSDAKPFDLGLYKDDVKKVTFDRAGRVDVFCSIHANMHCIILVLATPHFASTDAQGRFTLAEVPPGDYQLVAWHERLPPRKVAVTVPAEGVVTNHLTLGITGLPEY